VSENSIPRPGMSQATRDEIAAILCETIGESSAHKARINASKRVIPLLTWAATLRPDFINDTHALTAAVAEAERVYAENSNGNCEHCRDGVDGGGHGGR